MEWFLRYFLTHVQQLKVAQKWRIILARGEGSKVSKNALSLRILKQLGPGFHIHPLYSPNVVKFIHHETRKFWI